MNVFLTDQFKVRSGLALLLQMDGLMVINVLAFLNTLTMSSF
tara:strand:+ start:10555 stop:10680 length:126 start_codon:yes stop_codon:yes gene_type:complete